MGEEESAASNAAALPKDHVSSDEQTSSTLDASPPVAQANESASRKSKSSASTDFSDDVAKRQRRLSSDLPEVVPASMYQDKEAAYYDDNKEAVGVYAGKEAVPVSSLPESFDEDGGKEAVPIPIEPTPYEKPRPVQERLNRRICGVRAKWALLILLLIILAIALGAGLGAGLKKSKSKSGSRRNVQAGALNGTRIALATQSFPSESGTGSDDNLVMYYQHTDGHIRWMRLASNGSWVGGDESTDIANNAKNNTPISVVSYVWSGNNFWRVYYIDNTGVLRGTWNSNNTQGWALDPLSELQISPLDDDRVGMTACWYGSETVGSASTQGLSTTLNSSDLAIRLMYAENETSFQEIVYHGDTQQWVKQQTLSNLNGHASPACNNREPGSVDYMMFLDLNNAVNIYWKDSNTSLLSSLSHSTNSWTNSSVSIPGIQGKSVLGYLDYLYAESSFDNLIRGYNITFAAENTTAETPYVLTLHAVPGSMPGNDTGFEPAVSGSGFAVAPHDNSAGYTHTLAFYQTNSSDIIYYESGLDNGDFTVVNVTIPK
ncbi:hypothetical protein HII31_00154 [Pseudocercospora fuligena]|uniref:Fucose-specific lectin n=1 Tax=Pseudocercospora fuligena TaxID=685502 RepID=A0A8H6VNK2_9PEZI|nr:hypothetical protein HII31_00154 [Pseudocercospora fuligena]